MCADRDVMVVSSDEQPEHATGLPGKRHSGLDMCSLVKIEAELRRVSILCRTSIVTLSLLSMMEENAGMPKATPGRVTVLYLVVCGKGRH